MTYDTESDSGVETVESKTEHGATALDEKAPSSEKI